MSYAAIQALVSGKRPIWLYRIKKGATINLLTSRSGGWEMSSAYTVPDVDTGSVWQAAAITHSKIRQTSRSKAAEVELTLPNGHSVARQFLDLTGLEENSVTIWHGFEGAADMAVKFRGRVVSRRVSRTKIVLVCENNFTALRSKGLSAVAQRPCRHALYHGGCKLNLADWQRDGTVSAADGQVLTISEAGGLENGYLNGGVISFAGIHQMIIKHSGPKVTLLGPLAGLSDALASGDPVAVKIAPGCNRSMGMCASRFGNLDNHGGFPWMSGNPFDGRSVY